MTKPTCTIMPMPNPAMTLRKAAVRSAAPRFQAGAGRRGRGVARGRTIREQADVLRATLQHQPDERQQHDQAASAAATVVVAAKPRLAMPNSRIGTPVMPPTLAPSEAIETARP